MSERSGANSGTCWSGAISCWPTGDSARSRTTTCYFSAAWIAWRRKKGVRKIKRLGKDDCLVDWIKTKICPKWMEKVQWKQLPTTLLDASAYPATTIAELYR